MINVFKDGPSSAPAMREDGNTSYQPLKFQSSMKATKGFRAPEIFGDMSDSRSDWRQQRELHLVSAKEPNCTKAKRHLRDKPFKFIASTEIKEAAAARNPSADQQDSHQLQPPRSPSMQ